MYQYQQPNYNPYQQYVMQLIQNWPRDPRTGAMQLMRKYGPPHEASQSQLIWYHNGPWKKTIIYKEMVPHNFPIPHRDYLQQFIDYRAPLGKYDNIARFDGSVYLDRTKGEASARCHIEPMNFLALNLMHDVATGKRNVKNARAFYAKTANDFSKGTHSPYTQGFIFPKQRDTADPDVPYASVRDDDYPRNLNFL